MVTKSLSCWILLVILGFGACATLPADEPCKLKHLDGICQVIGSCKIAIAILKINDVQTLRAMHCGFEGASPKVCCPIANEIDAATTIRTLTTTPQYVTTTPQYVTSFADESRLPEQQIVTRAPQQKHSEVERQVPKIPQSLDLPLAQRDILPPVTREGPPTVQSEAPPRVQRSVLPGRDVCGLVMDEDKIFGGRLTAIDEFPWLARIKYYNPTKGEEMFACAGSLITDRFVVTAAHCIGVYKIVSVRLGEWDTETEIDCEDGFCSDPVVDLKVDKILVYPKYDKKNLTSGDIALLRLERSVTFTDFVRPVCLPSTPYVAKQDYIDSTYTTAGWGLTEFGRESVLKLKLNIDSVPYSLCQRTIPLLPKKHPAAIICAGGRAGQDTCRGDSGGPLLRVVSENYNFNWYLFGVTSYGVRKCGSTGKPGIYTRVTAFMDWIVQTLEENE
ncbi:CLIP domain-containing serine protease HP8-like [Epargyreus clarus]|uniref:CLIP domain-containing serine protease HP8-like n=1 Tax=Epargyreus clarus TaxID=520877 RepID=UPI003C2E134D